jgi:hypothetical protein
LKNDLPSDLFAIEQSPVDTSLSAGGSECRNRSASKRSPPHTRVADRLIATGVEIAASVPMGDDIAFAQAIFCQVGLPRRRVDGTEFIRKCGDAWISVGAGYLDEGHGPVLQPIPYGALPRLAIMYLNSYAIRHDTREIPIGKSAAEFLRLLGQDNQGGNRYTALRIGMHALAACRLQLGYRGRTFNGQPVEQFDAWLRTDEIQRSPWPGVLQLSTSYFDSLRGQGVPLDRRALLELRGSALELDIYVWLAHRLRRVHRNKPEDLSWRALSHQFGQEYTDASNFRKEMKRAIKLVLAVYPKAKLDSISGGIRLHHSPPPVPEVGRL